MRSRSLGLAGRGVLEGCPGGGGDIRIESLGLRLWVLAHRCCVEACKNLEGGVWAALGAMSLLVQMVVGFFLLFVSVEAVTRVR